MGLNRFDGDIQVARNHSIQFAFRNKLAMCRCRGVRIVLSLGSVSKNRFKIQSDTLGEKYGRPTASASSAARKPTHPKWVGVVWRPHFQCPQWLESGQSGVGLKMGPMSKFRTLLRVQLTPSAPDGCRPLS